MAKLGIYDPATVTVIIGTRKIDGYMDGSFVEVTRNNPKEITAAVGSRGEYGLVKNRDRSGAVTLTLQPESESNIYLGSLAGSDSIVPLFIQREGETIREIVTSPETWIEEVPQKSFDADNPPRAWLIGCGDLQQVDSGV